MKGEDMLPYEIVKPIHDQKIAALIQEAEIARMRRQARANHPAIATRAATVITGIADRIRNIGTPRVLRPAI